MKKLKLYFMAILIEWKWWRIGCNRRKMAKLIEGQEPYISPRLIELDECTLRLGFSAANLEKKYRELIQIGT